jgi:hypothetical protein
MLMEALRAEYDRITELAQQGYGIRDVATTLRAERKGTLVLAQDAIKEAIRYALAALPQPPAPRKAARTSAGPRLYSEIRKRRNDDELVVRRRGLARLRDVNDPAIWTRLANGVVVYERGDLSMPTTCEISKHLKSERRSEVALWALRGTGKLAGCATLRITSDSLEDLEVLRARVERRVDDGEVAQWPVVALADHPFTLLEDSISIEIDAPIR